GRTVHRVRALPARGVRRGRVRLRAHVQQEQDGAEVSRRVGTVYRVRRGRVLLQPVRALALHHDWEQAMTRVACAALLLWASVAPAVAADKPLVVDVWPGKPAGDDAGKIGEEKFIELKSAPNIKWITNVTKPTLTIFKPAKEKDTGVAMLICPGGGYHNL